MNFLEGLMLFLLGLILLSLKSEGKTLFFQSSDYPAMRSMNEWEAGKNHHPFDTNKSTRVEFAAIQFANGRLCMSYEIKGFYWYRSVEMVSDLTPKKAILPNDYDIQIPKIS